MKQTYEELEKKVKELESLKISHLIKNNDLNRTHESLSEIENISQKILFSANEFIEKSPENFDYEKIAQTISEISGAKYAVFNVFDDNGIDFTSVAISGINEMVFKATSILGFEIINKRWKHDPVRLEKIKNQTITHFDSLQELTINVIPQTVSKIIETTFRIGEVDIVKVTKNNKLIGDFTLIFSKGTTLRNKVFVEMFANQVGLFIERIRMDKTLKEREKRHKTILQTAMDGFWLTDTKLNFLEVNDAYCKMSRFSREELLKMNVSDVEAIETPEVSAARAKKIFELGEDRFLSQHIKKDGTIYDVEVSIQYRAENEGWFIVFIRDITERKFAERALSSIATNFAGLSVKEFFEAASKHIATEMGIDYVYVGELTDDKESVRVLGGFALDEAMGEMLYSLSETPCSDVIENDTCLYPSGIQQKYPKDYLLQQMGIDSYLGSRLYNKNQEPIGLMVALHSKPLDNPDILGNLFSIFSDRIAAELNRIHAFEALHKNEAIQRKMVSNIGDVVVIIDKNGINKYKSSNIEKCFGWKPEELVGKSTWDNVHPDDLLNGQNFISSISSEPNASGSLELRYRKKDDSYCWIKITIVNLLHDPDICGLLGNYHDITKRKNTEQSLRLTRFSVDHASEAIYWLTADSRIIDVNKAACKTLGYSRDELLQMKVQNIDINYNNDVWPQHFDALRKSGSLTFTTEHRAKNGQIIHVEVVANYVWYGNEECNCAFVRDITERKKAEDEIKLQNILLKTNQELSLDGILIVDEKGSILSYNKKFHEIWEIPQEVVDTKSDEKAYKSVFSLLRDPKAFLEKIEYLYKVKTEKSFDVIQLINGKILERYSAPMLDDLGQYFGRVWFFREITERKQNEAILTKLYTAINYSKASIVITDLDGNIEFANPYFTELTGYSKDEYLGKNSKVLKSGIHTDDFYKEMWDTIKLGNTWEGEICNRKKNGELYWEKSIITPIKNEKEEILNYVAVKSDISNEKKHKYLNDITLEIYEKSEHLTIEEILKYSIELSIQLTDSEIGFFHFVNDDQETISLQAWSAKTMEMCDVPTLDKHYSISNAGVWVDCFYQKIPVIHNDYPSLSHKKGLPEGHVALTRGLTVPVIVENQVLALYGVGNKKVDYDKIDAEFLSIFAENVWNIVRRKNAETSTINAKEKAEESEKLKTAFLQNMSHEIRTPLNGILGFSNLLQADDLSKEEIKEFTGVIQNSGLRLMETVGNILDISKIETGQIEVINKPFPLNSFISSLYTFFYNIASIKGVILDYNNPSKNSNLFIESDELKLNQILSNLISNALKFTTEGKVEFGYSIKNTEIEFYVKDTGVGIPDESKSRIFVRFAQANLSISRGYEGTGLGLSICKGLVELLDGKIWFESEVNKGTTFFFTIPFKPITMIDSIPENETKIPIIKEKIKILMAEDDWTSFQYVKKLLSNSDSTLIRAENGKLAVEIVKNNPDINLILMDIKMPVMNGIEATKIIKELRPDLPIIAQTAYAFSSERDEILALGCSDYISKPLKKAELFALIEKYTK